MKLLHSVSDYYSVIRRCIEAQPINISIISYGYNKSTEINNVFNDIIRLQIPLYMIIGYRDAQHLLNMSVNLEELDKLNGVYVRTNSKCHTKLWLFRYRRIKQMIIGSRNLGSSDWSEVSVTVHNQKLCNEMYDKFDNLWFESDPLETRFNFVDQIAAQANHVIGPTKRSK